VKIEFVIAVFELNCFFNFRQTFVAQKAQFFDSILFLFSVLKTDKTMRYGKLIPHHFIRIIFYDFQP
jgi:hypothetical protein